MIADSLSNLSTYTPLNDHIADMVKFLSENSLTALSPGKHPINGDDFFLLVFQYDSKPEVSAGWEAHRKYLDIHIVIEGAEKVFFEGIGKAKSIKPYDDQNDYELFETTGAGLTLTSDKFVIFYPQDVHKTGVLTSHEPEKVKKAVFKLKI